MGITPNHRHQATEVKEPPVTYWTLPHKSQLAILCLARIADPLAVTSVNSYIYFYVQHLKPEASSSEIATYIGILVGAKTAAKVATGLLWGRLSDSAIGGRKMVLLIGISSSCISTLGFGFTRSFPAAVFWQVLGTAMSSNVGMIRTIVADLNPEKRTRSRALLLLPLVAGMGMFLGPLLGGFLSARITTGPLADYPYALPNLVIATCYGLASLGVLFFLHETLDTHDATSRPFWTLWTKIRALSLRLLGRDEYSYSSIGTEAPMLLEESPAPSPVSSHQATLSGKSPQGASSLQSSSPLSSSKLQNITLEAPIKPLTFRQIWTSQVIATLFAQFIINGHMGTFSTLWVVFLSTPVAPLSSSTFPLAFTGGIGLSASSIGTLLSTLAGTGVLVQFFIYPYLSDRFSTVRIWRTTLLVFPLGYLLAPFPALVAAHYASSGGVAGSNNSGAELYERSPAVIAAILGVLLLLTLGRMGVTPATTLLLNDCVPAPSARGTINMAGTVTASLSKCIFPPAALAIYGWGLQHGVVGSAFWALSGVAVAAWGASWWVKDGEKKTVLVAEGSIAQHGSKRKFTVNERAAASV